MKRAMKPIHPGAILREDVLKPYNLTITDAARDLQISRKQLSEIVNEKSSITTEMAILLQLKWLFVLSKFLKSLPFSGWIYREILIFGR